MQSRQVQPLLAGWCSNDRIQVPPQGHIHRCTDTLPSELPSRSSDPARLQYEPTPARGGLDDLHGATLISSENAVLGISEGQIDVKGITIMLEHAPQTHHYWLVSPRIAIGHKRLDQDLGANSVGVPHCNAYFGNE
jgi:hypothetical protein